MTLLRRFRTWFSRRYADESGSMPIEGVMGFLLIMGWFLVAFQLFDAFRIKSINAKAAYTVADLISREREPVGPSYVAGMKKVFEYITNDRGTSWIRITSIYWDGNLNKYRVDFSRATDGKPIHTDDTINAEAHRIPQMPVGDTAVIVETSMNYDPIFSLGQREIALGGNADGKTFTNIGLTDRIRFSNFVVTRPRGPRVVWSDTH